MKPNDFIAHVQSSTTEERVNYCRAFLFLHDFITPSEHSRIKKRIQQWRDECHTTTTAPSQATS